MTEHPPTYEIREPVETDVDGFAALHARVWRETYRGLMSDESIEALDAATFAPMWSSITTAYATGTVREDGRGFMVALADGEPVGFCMHGPARDAEAPSDHQLWSLNVAPEHQGSGLADQLVEQTLGDRPAYLWVAEGNERAIAFYRRHGFELDGGVDADGQGGVRELRMVRQVR